MLKRIFVFLGIVFFVLSCLLAIAFLILREVKVKKLVEHEIEETLGIKVTIDKLEFSPLFVHIGAKGIIVHNPAGFKEGELAYINSIHLVIDPLEIISRKKPNIYLFALDLERLTIIKNSDGKVNIKEITPIKQTGAATNDGSTEFYFDVMILSINEVRYIEYTDSGRKERIYPIKINNAPFVGLNNEDEVTKMILYKALENTEIGKLINLTVTSVVSNLNDAMNSAWGTAKSGLKGTVEIVTLPFKMLLGRE